LALIENALASRFDIANMAAIAAMSHASSSEKPWLSSSS